MENNKVNETVEVLESGALQVLEKASIDMQIATAKQYPRSITRFTENAASIACVDEDTAASCLYRRPVGKEHGVQKFAEGMSVRLAEICAASYGNLRYGARIISQTERKVTAQGVAHDLEQNLYASTEVVESTVTSNGKPYSERMRITVAKAALAKARRDAIFQVIPRALAVPVERKVKKLLFGEESSLTKWRERIAEWIKLLGIDENRVFKAIDVEGIADMNQKHFEKLLGIKTAIQDNEITIDDAFPDTESRKANGLISAGQRQKLGNLIKSMSYDHEIINEYLLKVHGFETNTDITVEKYQEITEDILADKVDEKIKAAGK